MKYLAIGLLRLYQILLSPLVGGCCRFYPTCSEYAIQALRKHGFFYGCWLALKRVVRCSPSHLGGKDEVP